MSKKIICYVMSSFFANYELENEKKGTHGIFEQLKKLLYEYVQTKHSLF